MAAKKKSASRKSAGKQAATTRKPRAAGKKVARTRKARPAAVPAAITDLDGRIATLRANLRELTEQAAASSGASTEELTSQRITEQETKLQLLIKERDKLARRGS
jgi:hypothetical protein